MLILCGGDLDEMTDLQTRKMALQGPFFDLNENYLHKLFGKPAFQLGGDEGDVYENAQIQRLENGFASGPFFRS